MCDTIEKLVEIINDELNSGKALIDILHILNMYCGDDWIKHENYTESRYCRNLVYRDDNIEVLILCWNSCQKSGVHDHPENGCIVKILKGKLIEEVYDRDSVGDICKTGENFIDASDNSRRTSYQRGKEGLHNIINPSENKAVTMHIYSPPNYRPKFYC